MKALYTMYSIFFKWTLLKGILEFLKALISTCFKYSKEANEQYKDKIVPVLIEGFSEKDESMLMGYTDTMKLVNIKGNKDLIGSIVNVKITEVKTWSMDGEVVE